MRWASVRKTWVLGPSCPHRHESSTKGYEGEHSSASSLHKSWGRWSETGLMKPLDRASALGQRKTVTLLSPFAEITEISSDYSRLLFKGLWQSWWGDPGGLNTMVTLRAWNRSLKAGEEEGCRVRKQLDNLEDSSSGGFKWHAWCCLLALVFLAKSKCWHSWAGILHYSAAVCSVLMPGGQQTGDPSAKENCSCVDQRMPTKSKFLWLRRATASKLATGWNSGLCWYFVPK